MRTIARESIQAIALATLLALLFQSGAQAFQVQGPSMEPSLDEYDYLLVDKAGYLALDAERAARYIPGIEAEPGETWRPFGRPKRGDIIVFRYPLDPEQLFVKRIVGMPGDAVRIEDGALYVNQKPLEEPYVESSGRQSFDEVVVEPGRYYVLGDNRAQSSDSRQWGTVPEENIVGEVAFRFWPFSRFGTFGNLGSPLW